MDEKQLDELQNKLYRDYIEVLEEEERLIINTAKNLSTQLYFHPTRKMSVEFMGKSYRVSYFTKVEDFQQLMFFIAIPEDTSRPVPIICKGEINNGLSEQENLRAIIGAFLRDRAGRTEVGVIE